MYFNLATRVCRAAVVAPYNLLLCEGPYTDMLHIVRHCSSRG